MKEEKKLSELYNKVAKKYHQSRKDKTKVGFQCKEVERPMMFKLVPKILKSSVLLDIGCAGGIHLKEYVKRGAECHGVDLSKNLINIAKKESPESEVKIGSIYKIPFKKNSFDIITASLVLDHVQEISKAIKEVKRVLKKQGIFIFTIPHPIGYMFRQQNPSSFVPTYSYYNTKKTNYNIVKEGLKFPGFPRTLQNWFDILIKNGFQLEEYKENKPDPKWRKKYKDLGENFFKAPLILGMVWKKK